MGDCVRRGQGERGQGGRHRHCQKVRQRVGGARERIHGEVRIRNGSASGERSIGTRVKEYSIDEQSPGEYAGGDGMGGYGEGGSSESPSSSPTKLRRPLVRTVERVERSLKSPRVKNVVQ